MKDQVRTVILENEDLHQKLNFLTAEYTLGEQALLHTSVSFYFSVVVLTKVQ